MKGFHLKPDELVELHAAHRAERNKRYAYRIHAIILLGTAYTIKKVKQILFIDDETLRSYVDTYRSEGLPGLLSDGRTGKSSKLTDEQINHLKEELDTNIHLTTASVINFVNTRFSTDYSTSGMRDLLHRIGYVHKKPKLVPGKPDTEAQDVFLEQYEAFMDLKAEGIEVVFIDAVHPEHNALAAYGWIKRGSTRELKTNSGRQRLNLHGAINAETHEITVIESETVDSSSTINLFSAIENKYPAAPCIKVILDNAKYHYSTLVKEYVENSRIELVFLPSYSPNLNLIERLWGFFKKKVLYNTYYENIKAFRSACITFFSQIDKYQKEISAFMSAEFHIE